LGYSDEIVNLVEEEVMRGCRSLGGETPALRLMLMVIQVQKYL
jgi:hypothetical protein